MTGSSIDWVEAKIDIEQAAKRLTKRQRQAFRLFTLGYTQDEMAREMGVDQSVASRHLRKAIERIRVEMKLIDGKEKSDQFSQREHKNTLEMLHIL